MAHAGQVASDAPSQGAQAAQGFAVPGATPEQAQSIARDPAVQKWATAAATAPTERARAYAKSQMDLAVADAKQRQSLQNPTDVQRNYAQARREGYQGSLVQYQKELRQQTNVNIEQRSEGEFAKASGKAIAERVDGMAKDGDAAASDLQALAELRSLGGQFQTGGTSALQGWLADKGIKVGPQVDKVEAYSALIDKLTPQQRAPGSGATSDFDAKMFKASLPRLINTPGGNEIIIGTLEKLADNRLQRADIAAKMQTGELSVKDGVLALRDLQKAARDQSMALRETSKQGAASSPPSPNQPPAPVSVKTPDEYQRLRPGDQYTAPDGTIRTKR
jgi:hypothetical protein